MFIILDKVKENVCFFFSLWIIFTRICINDILRGFNEKNLFSKNVLSVKTKFINSKNKLKPDLSMADIDSKIPQLTDPPPESLGIGINE